MGTAGIVLAAGEATRMGRHKVLLRLGGETLVHRSVRAAIEAGLEPVVVVLGHEAAPVEDELAGVACRTVSNPHYGRGMNTSLEVGLGALSEETTSAVVLLADMPFVDADLVRSLVTKARETRARLVVCRYAGVTAPPTLYARSLFQELRCGEGEGRGREVVRQHLAEAAFVDAPATALLDVDRAEDLERALARLASGEAR
jgi:molybdenum cofactor cytidylyltransferase